MKKLVISVVLVNLLVACASEKPKETATAPVSTASKPVVAAAPQSAPSPAPAPFTQDDPLKTPEKFPLLAKRSVYYPLDSSVVQDADKPVVEAHARYLSERSNRKVRLEGNCDERGSNEYNLALGQRRADGVMKMLELGGARASQIESVSYGEEKPKSSGHDEAAWAQNRRTDLIYAR
ncbi:MAG: peptidoglycan-associated lipoprotein Pal [Nitrosomonadales bacterium]|nr:peptidoglycan-associated lipoprotein Pal [Nitrosomonadales bacterium]